MNVSQARTQAQPLFLQRPDICQHSYPAQKTLRRFRTAREYSVSDLNT